MCLPALLGARGGHARPSLRTSSHAADQGVFGDAVAAEKLCRALEVKLFGERTIGLVSHAVHPGRPQDLDDVLPADLCGDQQPPSLHTWMPAQ
jgi:hypothetical protein